MKLIEPSEIRNEFQTDNLRTSTKTCSTCSHWAEMILVRNVGIPSALGERVIVDNVANDKGFYSILMHAAGPIEVEPTWGHCGQGILAGSWFIHDNLKTETFHGFGSWGTFGCNQWEQRLPKKKPVLSNI